jgi:hypothetical protein
MTVSDVCEHLEHLTADAHGVLGAAASGDGCVECLLIGGHWVHLRRCLECGHIGCCDNSPGRHATGHFHGTQHPTIQSFEPREEWVWCFVDEQAIEPSGLQRSPAHP